MCKVLLALLLLITPAFAEEPPKRTKAERSAGRAMGGASRERRADRAREHGPPVHDPRGTSRVFANFPLRERYRAVQRHPRVVRQAVARARQTWRDAQALHSLQERIVVRVRRVVRGQCAESGEERLGVHPRDLVDRDGRRRRRVDLAVRRRMRSPQGRQRRSAKPRLERVHAAQVTFTPRVHVTGDPA